jgi:hypothetical protein
MPKVRRSNPKVFVNDVLQFQEKSGNLSNSFKKSLDRKSFEIGTLPINQKISGKKLEIIDHSFDDSTVFEFVPQQINPRLGVPYYPISSLATNSIPILDDAIIVHHKVEAEAFSEIGGFQTFIGINTLLDLDNKRKISNTPIFSYPNRFSDFNSVVKAQSSFIESTLRSEDLDIYLEKQNVHETYEPFDETSKIIVFGEDQNWEEKNVNNVDSYHFKNSKQIKIDVDFEQSPNALLINTANTKVDDNFIALDNRTVTRFSQNTAYWNFSNNRWEYINAEDDNGNNITPGADGFLSADGFSLVLPLPADTSLDIDVPVGNLNVNNTMTLHSKITNNITSPSFRLNTENPTNLMQTTSSSGFPNDFKWNPNDNQTLKMSDYITSDFMLEKIIIKFKTKTSLKINSNEFTDHLTNNIFSDDKSYYGLSFFFLRNNKFLNKTLNNKISNIDYYYETFGDGGGDFDPDNILADNSNSIDKVNGILSNGKTFKELNNFFDSNDDNTKNGKLLNFVSKTSSFQVPSVDEQNVLAVDQTDTNVNNEIDLIDNEFSSFYFLTDVSSNFGNDHIKIAADTNDFGNNDFENAYALNEIAENSGPGSSSFRDIISLTNVMFTGGSLDPDFTTMIENDKNIDLVVERSDQIQSIEVKANLKRSRNIKYFDESIFFSNDLTNTFIFEGKNEELNYSRIFNSKNIAENIQSEYINAIDYPLVEVNQTNIIEEYNYLLKPSDEIIFGISSYGNGNLISTTTELFDNIDIILVGKEVENINNEDYSKSIRKVITPFSSRQSNDDIYTDLKDIKPYNKNKNINKAFFKSNMEKYTASTSQNSESYLKNYITDSSLPNFINFFKLMGKSIATYHIQSDVFSPEHALGNTTLFNNVKSNDSSWETAELIIGNDVTTIKSNSLFHDEVYKGDYIFNVSTYFDDVSNTKVETFDNVRYTNDNIITTLNNTRNTSQKVTKTDLLDATSDDIDKITDFVNVISFDEIGFSAGQESKIHLGFPTDINRTTTLQDSLIRYTGPNENRDGLNQKTLSVLGIENDDTYNFKYSDINYEIDHNVNEADSYSSQVSIQRSRDGKTWYLVLHNTPIASPPSQQHTSNFIQDLLDDPDFAIHKINAVEVSSPNLFKNSRDFFGSSQANLMLEVSRHSFPLTIAAFNSAIDNSKNVPFNDTTTFTKEFLYCRNFGSNDSGRLDFLVAKLEYWEVGEIIESYHDVGSITSNRTNVLEVPYTSSVNSDSLITNITSHMIDDFADVWVGHSNYSSSTYDANYLSNNFQSFNASNEDFVLMIPAITRSGIPLEFFTNGQHELAGQDQNNNSIYNNIVEGMRTNFTVKFHKTKYKLKSNNLKTPVYKFSDIVNRLPSKVSDKIKNVYHHFIDKKILEDDFLMRQKVYEDLDDELDSSKVLFNNEFIYSSKIYFARDKNDRINDLIESNYELLFKFRNYDYNGISWDFIEVLSVIDGKAFSSNFKPSYEETIINTPNVFQFMRVYEPNYLKMFKDKLLINEGEIPYFELAIADLGPTQSTRKDRSRPTTPRSLATQSSFRNIKYVINSPRVFNFTDGSKFNDFNLNVRDRSPKNYGPWGSQYNKEKNINDLVYTYGDRYTNFPCRGKKGYVYGVQSSTKILENTYFETYRYGQFSDHIKYTTSHVTVSYDINQPVVVDWIVEKKFYNAETFQRIDEPNMTVNGVPIYINKNVYAKSNYPYIEDETNILSQHSNNA